MIQRLLVQFDTEAKTLDWSNAKHLGVSDYQVVIIASMIEREAPRPWTREAMFTVWPK